jgi:predicted DNA-binding transcriptional regulator AlpA
MLTAKELEAILKIDVKTIYSYVQRGLIPYVRIQSNVRFLKREIFEWIEKQSYRPWSVAEMAAKSGTKTSAD